MKQNRAARKIQVNECCKTGTGKKCIHCNKTCWRSDLNYCWDCYKYEMFESR